MVVVSQSSWHYKFYKRWRKTVSLTDKEPISLCPYFWTVAVVAPLTYLTIALGKIGYHLFLRPLLWFVKKVFGTRAAKTFGRKLGVGLDRVGAGFPVIVVLAGAALLSYELFLAFRANWGWTLAGIGIAVGAIALVFALIAGFVLLDDRYGHVTKDQEKVAKPKKVRNQKGDGFFKLLVRFLVARKRKVCPMIEVVE